MSINYPIYASCSHCGKFKDLVCGDGTGNHFCSGDCCAAHQAPQERSHRRDEQKAMQLADDEQLMAQGFYESHMQDCDGGWI